MSLKRIRPIVICLFKHHDSILVLEGYDNLAKRHFYRPIGGGIEYGENSDQALIREVKEEINATIYDLQLLEVVENIFTYEGEQGHEVVFVYDAKFEDETIYNKSSFLGIEDNGGQFKLLWIKKEEFISSKLYLVPEKLISML